MSGRWAGRGKMECGLHGWPEHVDDRTTSKPTNPMQRLISHLDALEAESIHLLREVAAEFERPVLLFSGGKDSVVMLHLAKKAFWPARLPFPVMHVDTGHNFPEVIEFRDASVERARRASSSWRRCRSRSTRAASSRTPGRARRATGCRPRRCSTRSKQHGFDAVMGGARRDEEKARAKERFFSFRDEFGQWDPKNQRPELWNLYNGRHRKGEHIRVFPLSNWTELDIWQYIADEEIELPSIYFAHRRDGVPPRRHVDGGHRLPAADDGEEVFEATVRYRTVGDATCTAAVESSAVDDRRRHRRGRGVAHHRARRDPRRRQVLRSGHGRPQAGGLLLDGRSSLRASPTRRLGRRRQVAR